MEASSFAWTIQIDVQQEQAIRTLFKDNNWELVEKGRLPSPEKDSGATLERKGQELDGIIPTINLCPELVEGQECTSDTVHEHIGFISDKRDSQVPLESPSIFNTAKVNECPFCLCSPCVTTSRPRWLGIGQRPRAGNNLLRKKKYKKYWKMIKDRGAWDDPRYLQRKDTAQGHANGDIAWLPSVREIMPECVLKLVRGLFPNLPGIPYMGHRWM